MKRNLWDFRTNYQNVTEALWQSDSQNPTTNQNYRTNLQINLEACFNNWVARAQLPRCLVTLYQLEFQSPTVFFFFFIADDKIPIPTPMDFLEDNYTHSHLSSFAFCQITIFLFRWFHTFLDFYNVLTMYHNNTYNFRNKYSLIHYIPHTHIKVN